MTRDAAGLDYHVFARVVDIVDTFDTVERILIDIPIGLPWSGAPIRPCDQLARRVLGRPRGSSVFAVPCRQALKAAGLEQAKAVNISELGRSLGSQTWGICPKIAEVDAFMQNDDRQYRLREIHPEVCFWALAGGKPMTHKKSKSAGREERLAVLESHEPDVEGLLRRVLSETSRRDVESDDVLDAAVACVTSGASGDQLDRLVGTPSHDETGLPMEMLYWRGDEAA